MEWSEAYHADNQPTGGQIAEFIRSPLWGGIVDYLSRAYQTEPKYSYSACALQRGWNVKFSKGGKALCTLYPMDGYYIALVIVGPKEMAEAELMAPLLSGYVRGVFNETAVFQSSKWLMLEIRDADALADALRLIALRRKPGVPVNTGS